MSPKNPTTCVVGGGNSAHVLIPFLADAGHRVHLLTRRPEDWQDTIDCEITEGRTDNIIRTHSGHLHKKSSDPVDVVPEADIIVLCLPVHQYRPLLDRIAPYIDPHKEVFVGTVYGQAGFNWMVHAIEKEHKLENTVAFAIGSIPWICRTKKYGKTVTNYGGKEVNTVAVTPADRFDKLNQIFLQDISVRPLGVGAFRQTCSFLCLTMSVDNQVIHPARCYGLWKRYGGKWASQQQVPYFYRDFDEQSAENIRKLDGDYTAIRQAIRKRFPDRTFKYMLNYVDLERLNHKSNHVDILASLRDSQQLASIKTPTIETEQNEFVLNTKHRFFTDDIPYGLLIAKWLAEQLEVTVPFVDEVIMWAQTLRGERFLNDDGTINRSYCLKDKCVCGIPESYGIDRFEDILD